MATQNAINNTIQNPTITGAVTLSSLTANTAVILDASKALASSATTSTELGYLSGVTSSVQTQLNSKANLTGGNTLGGTQIFSGATASTVPYFDGTKALTSSSVTSTELGYLSGVTSSIQTQLNAKAGTSSPSFIGTVGVDGRIVLSGNYSFIAAVSNAYLYHDNTNGLVMYGAGSSYDVICNSGSGVTAWAIPTGTANTTFFGDLSITGSKTVSIANANASTTLSNFTQSLTNAGLLINATYTANAYTSGIFWATSDNNPTKPKAGIFMQTTAGGTYLFFGTSNAYATGIVNTVAIDYNGQVAANRYSATSTSTTENVVSVTADSLTAGSAGYFYSNSSSSSSRKLVNIVNNNTGATATTALYINQKANYTSQFIAHEGTTIGALYVEANSIQTGGYCAYFISNSKDTGARNLVLCQNSNSLATGTVSLNVQQFAANYAMVVQGYANGVLYYLNGAGNTTTNIAEFSCNTLTTGSIMSLYSQSTDTSSRPLFWIRQNSSAATGTTGIQIDHISSGYCMKISQSVNNANACYGLQMNIANAGAGLEYAFRFDGSEIVASAVGGSQNKKVQVSVAGTNYYIPLYTA